MSLMDEKPPAPRIARAIRITAGVSQAAMAAELGCHRTTVNRWEMYARRPRGELAKRYAALLRELEGRVNLP